jgi:hypothetical protein
MLDLLQPHPGMESRLGIDARHVIVDQPDWRVVYSHLNELPLTADKVVLWPGSRVFMPNIGKVCAYTVTMVGQDGRVQVTDTDRSGGDWEESAASLYGHLTAATQAALKKLAAWEASLATPTRETTNEA